MWICIYRVHFSATSVSLFQLLLRYDKKNESVFISKPKHYVGNISHRIVLDTNNIQFLDLFK